MPANDAGCYCSHYYLSAFSWMCPGALDEYGAADLELEPEQEGVGCEAEAGSLSATVLAMS